MLHERSFWLLYPAYVLEECLLSISGEKVVPDFIPTVGLMAEGSLQTEIEGIVPIYKKQVQKRIRRQGGWRTNKAKAMVITETG